MSSKNKLKSSVKYPTSLIVGGDDFLGFEIAKSLVEQGGYVIIIDKDSEKTQKRYEEIKNRKLLTILDYSSVEFLEDDLRRLDYVFYLSHNYDHPGVKLSSQEFLQYSNYLDLIINLTSKYKAKLLLSSSIKANQMILNSQEEIDFGKNAQEKHAVYSQTEMQRYAEALVFESIEKIDLDARVTRLGRVIGPRMDFEVEHSFDRLVMDAVMGKDFKLKSDGLESNMYVHVLDAAYGIIKAMFTKDTKGKIFSISNDEEITDLSIAYKLQELVGLEQEIKFDSGSDDYPAIKYHKPAKSLISIGWLPRVSFHRGLVQSFDYAKEILVEEMNKSLIKGEEESEEETTESLITSDDLDEPKGALARLIAERKAQEVSRRGSILIANEKIKDRSKAKRELSTSDKIDRFFRKQYDSITHRLRFLKRITLSELVFYFTLFFIFAVIYVGFLAPVFVMLKNLVVIEYYSIALERHVEDENYQLIAGDVDHISDNISEFSDNHKKFESVYTLISYEEDYQSTQDSLNALSLHIQAVSEAFELNQDFYDLLSETDYSLVYRPSGESLLDLGPSNVDKDKLAAVLANSVKADQLDTKIEITSQAVKNKPVGKILGYDMSGLYDKVYDLEESSITFSKFTQNFSEYFISDGTKTYTIVLQDDSRYTPGGGYPAAIGIVQVKGGELLDIELVSFSEEDLSESIILEDSELELVQAASTDFKTADNTTFGDLFLLPDKASIEDDLNEYVYARFGVESQAIFFVNTNFQKQVLEAGNELEINQVVVREDTFFSSVELLMRDDDSVNKKNQVLSNILALEIIEIVDEPDLLYQLVDSGGDILNTKQIEVESSTSQIAYEVGGDEIVTNPLPELAIFPVIDPNVVNSTSYPNVTVTIKDDVETRTQINRQIKMSFSNAQDLERLVICMPRGVDDLTSDVALAKTFVNDELCLSFDASDLGELNLEYSFEPFVETLENNEYNISSTLVDTPGFMINYDVEISSASFDFAPSDELVNSSGKLIASGELSGDMIINFRIRK